MQREESVYPADWLRIAERDIARASRLLDEHDIEAAGFYLQQAVEKYLKAYLLSKGWRLRRTHDLESLINDALDFDVFFHRFREVCNKITGYYFVERYPFIAEAELGSSDISGSLEQVEELIEFVRNEVS